MVTAFRRCLKLRQVKKQHFSSRGSTTEDQEYSSYACGSPVEGQEHCFYACGSTADKKTDNLTLAGAPQEQKETF